MGDHGRLPDSWGGTVSTPNLVVSPRTPNTPIVNRQGQTAYDWVKFFQNLAQAVNSALTILGEFNGIIGTQASIEGRAGTLAGAVQHLSATGFLASTALTGVLQSGQLPAAVPTSQGAVVLPSGAVSNTLGSASLAETTAFDPAGSAAAAQTAAEAYAAAQASAAQTAAESFASNASNIVSGTLAAAQLPAGAAVVSFGTGAPAAASTEGYLYFDTSVTPYQGYVYHSGAWDKIA